MAVVKQDQQPNLPGWRAFKLAKCCSMLPCSAPLPIGGAVFGAFEHAEQLLPRLQTVLAIRVQRLRQRALRGRQRLQSSTFLGLKLLDAS